MLIVTGAAFAAAPDTLEPGSLPGSWLTGGPNCLTLPLWEVYEYNPTFYILRESGCTNYEKPFLYLIFGDQGALLEDTGAGKPDTGPFVLNLIETWAKQNKRPVPKLTVIHSHGHGDHVAGDAQFDGKPNVELIKAQPVAIQKAAGITTWPQDLGSIDLGNRIIDVIPIPGHEAASIALYDRRTGNLLTGDSLYPGRLYVNAAAVPTFADSAARLAKFVETHPVVHVLGTHIEQSATAYQDYPRGTTYQPAEHRLALDRAHVVELNDALARIREKPETVALPDFTISVRK